MRRPERTPLEGRAVRLEPLDASRHGPALWRASHGPGADPRLWDYLPYGPYADEAEMSARLAAAAASEDPLFYAIVPAGGDPAGVASYLRIEPEHGVIEIGHIWFGAPLQRTVAATEAIHLLARNVFDLGYRRLEWKTDERNERSRRAAERFGFTFEGIFRQDRVVKDRNRNTAWFSLLDGEWPAMDAAFQAWLDPSNFDAEGRQRRPLKAPSG